MDGLWQEKACPTILRLCPGFIDVNALLQPGGHHTLSSPSDMGSLKTDDHPKWISKPMASASFVIGGDHQGVRGMRSRHGIVSI